MSDDTDRRPIRVVVAHESYLVREFLTAMLGRTTDVQPSAVCSNGTDLQRAIAVWLPDVVLTGTRMPPSGAGEGIQLAGRLRQTAPETGVVVIAERVEPESVLALLDQGTHRRGYLLTERIRSLHELIAAIETVAAGGSVLDPLVVDALVQIRLREARSRLSELTPREHDVLAKIALGDSNGAIAQSLCLTKRAVEKHVNSIFSKLDLRDEDSVSPRVKATRIFLTESVPTELRDTPAIANHPYAPPPVP